MFDDLEAANAHRVVVMRDAASGLRAVTAIDSVALGPGFGGIRTIAYPSTTAALVDAQKLAAAMTLKCAIAGLPAGGAKTVVIDHPGMNRAEAFRRLGLYIQDLGGLYRCAGDLGTTAEDLGHVAEFTGYVNTTGEQLGTSTGIGIVNCIRACADHRGLDGLQGLKVAIQGCGLIGAGVARMLHAAGAILIVADVSAARAQSLANELGASAVAADAIFTEDVDIIAPCAVGNVISPEVTAALKAWGVCGGANNQLTSDSVAADLAACGILYVPDFLASAGAVIDGVSVSLPGGDSAEQRLAAMYDTARLILREADAIGTTTTEVATRIARDRIEAGTQTYRA